MYIYMYSSIYIYIYIYEYIYTYIYIYKYVKVLVSVGKSSIHGLCSIAMFDYWRVNLVNHKIYVNGVENLCLLMSIGGFILSHIMGIVTILSPNFIPSGNQTWIDGLMEDSRLSLMMFPFE